VEDEQLLAWLAQPEQEPAPTLEYGCIRLPVRHVMRDALASMFDFVPAPRPDA
jgi:hypothetical protein